MTNGIAHIKSSRPKWMDGAAQVPPEAGNVWFVGDEPKEQASTAARIAVAALIAVSAGSVIGGIAWLNHIFN